MITLFLAIALGPRSQASAGRSSKAIAIVAEASVVAVVAEAPVVPVVPVVGVVLSPNHMNVYLRSNWFEL